MDRAYIELVMDFIEEGDYESAQAALESKMEKGDGNAYAVMGSYVYLGVFTDTNRSDAFKYWEQGAQLGDFDCKGLCYLENARLFFDEETEDLVLSIGKKKMDQMLSLAAKGQGFLYEFLLGWTLQDHFSLELFDRQFLRLICEGLASIKKTNPLFLEGCILSILALFSRIPIATVKDFHRLLQIYEDMITEEHVAVCAAFAAEAISFYPDSVEREKLLLWVSYMKDLMPDEYHCLMGALRDMDCQMQEVILHVEQAYQNDPNSGLTTGFYAYCLMKGKGITKDLRETERLLCDTNSNYALLMRAHCRMFIDPEHPDIEGAIELLDQADEEMTVYWDSMLYLLYAESKHALTAPLKQRLKEEIEEAKQHEPDTYHFLQGVQLALSPNRDDQKVADYFQKKNISYNDLIPIWLCGVVGQMPFDTLSDLVCDDHIDTDMRYQLAVRLVMVAAQQKDLKALEKALHWADSLGGQCYALRKRVLRHVLDIVGENDSRKRHPKVKRFLAEYDELKEEGLSNYLRAWIEVCHFKLDRKRLKQFVDLTVQSQDSYAIICVGHLLMHMRSWKDVQWGLKVQKAGTDISPFNRTDWIIEAVTGGYYMDVLM